MKMHDTLHQHPQTKPDFHVRAVLFYLPRQIFEMQSLHKVSWVNGGDLQQSGMHK